MAIKIINSKLVGTINKLKDKLEGKLPIHREELLFLVNSWGRTNSFCTIDSNDFNVIIKECEKKECYDLSKLDTSQITNMQEIFKYSMFNGDISNWNVSNVTKMKEMFNSAKEFNSSIGNWDMKNIKSTNNMFYNAESFNQDINSWDTSNIINMGLMFAYAKKFDKNISKWNLENVKMCFELFYNADAFLDKYNNSLSLPKNTKDILEWFNNNKEKMNIIDIKDTHGKEIDDFFTDIYSMNRIGLHKI